jgi:uncharacterized protein involved in exopolysaccharide biosynthesis
MSNRESIDINFQQVNRSIRSSGLLAASAFAACVALAALASTQITPTYTADSKLLFTNVDRASALTGFGSADQGELRSLLADQTPLATQMEVITSRPLLQATIDSLNLKDDTGELLTPEALSPNLDVSIVGGTDVVEILYTNPDPQIAAAVINTLVDEYRESSINTRRDEAKEAKEFLLAKLPQTEAQVRQADADLRDFLEKNNIGVLEEEATSLVARSEVLANQISTVQSDLAATASQARSLQNKLNLTPDQALIVGSLSQNPGVQEALLALQAVERDLANQQARYSPNSPVIRQLIAQQKSLQGFLQQQIADIGNVPNVPASMIQANPAQVTIMQALIQDFLDNEIRYTGLQQQFNVLKSYEANYQKRLSSIPSLSASQRELQRRIAVAEETYQALLTRLQELQVQENETSYNTQVIQPATVPSQPDSGAKTKILALGVMAGVLSAIAIIVIAEVLRSKALIGSSSEMDKETQDFDVIASSNRD